MDIVAAFNLFESGLWTVFAILTAVLGGRVRGLTPRLRIGLALAFLAFGISDLIEMKTGAWWRPPGLLVLKGSCLTCFALICWRVYLNRRPSLSVPQSSESATRNS